MSFLTGSRVFGRCASSRDWRKEKDIRRITGGGTEEGGTKGDYRSYSSYSPWAVNLKFLWKNGGEL